MGPLVGPWEQGEVRTHPQCFMFSGLSMRQAIFMRRSWSGQLLGTVMRCHSGDLEDRGVGRRITFPISLSSRANMPWLSVYSFTLTTGSGCVVVKSPCVSHL